MKFSFLALVSAALFFFALSSPAGAEGTMEMGTIACPGHAFNCDTLVDERDEIIGAANECIKTFMGIKESILDAFGNSGDKENCAVARNSSYRNDNGFKEWAVCCVKPINGAEGCKLSCTRYLDNTKSATP